MIKELIKHERARPSSSSTNSSNTDVFLSDKSRLIYSSAFRRLQQKAQVFSLESNSAVRSRLTHSLEVAHIGRSLVAAVEAELSANCHGEDIYKEWRDELSTIMTIVETSCLMHDLGNPPFGHFCEAAISQWFKSEECDEIIKKALTGEVNENDLSLDDFCNFDGNPQGLRIATKLQGDDGETGLNLTYTQLASFIKYVAGPSERNPNEKFKKKVGYFSTEKELYENIYKTHGMPLNSRHPFAFLMEAADDISYCISDIEDGIEKKVITENSFFEYFFDNFRAAFQSVNSDFKSRVDNLIEDTKERIANEKNGKEVVIRPFLNLKTKLSSLCVKEAARLFVLNRQEIFLFSFHQPIIDGKKDLNKLLEILKGYTRQNVFSSYEAESMEISGFSIVSGILSSYKKLLILDRNKFKKIVDGVTDKNDDLDVEVRLFNRLPERYVKAYSKAECNSSIGREWNLRAHLVIDFIAGMTDNFALDTYKMLHGIRL
ncbi:dGTPase [Pantoea ananatis]|jgi:dGTPase|uniref:dGTPase n=1 Tax=Pantoea ananas TaxID=553 RepID=UPI0025CB1E38|nr:dGTPase [Pantoea ananatis]MDN4134177.1 dGTPase [Pantoea ananatis]